MTIKDHFKQSKHLGRFISMPAGQRMLDKAIEEHDEEFLKAVAAAPDAPAEALAKIAEMCEKK